MKYELTKTDAVLRHAHSMRNRAIADFFSRLANNLSPRLPKILQDD
jgi:hypothetical protein